MRELLPSLPEAACKKEDPALFFGPHVCGIQCDGVRGCHEAKSETGRYARIQAAKRVCFTCEERIPCLSWALDTDQPFGVWGGKTERERKSIKREQTRSPLN